MEVNFENAKYKTGRLDGRTQYHLSRKLGPALLAYGQAINSLREKTKGDAEKSEDAMGDIASVFAPVADAFAALSEADADYVMGACLFVCEREQEGAWAKVAVKVPVESGYFRLMFQDISSAQMMQMMFAVIKENLESFF